MRALRTIIILALALFSAFASANSSSGIWTSNTDYYLVLMEKSSTTAVVALAISHDYQSGLVFTGVRASDTITLKTLDGKSSLDVNLNGSSYNGTYASVDGSNLAISGQKWLDWSGNQGYSLPLYDGIWQKIDGSTRYLVIISTDSNSPNGSVVLVDLQLGASGLTTNVDVSIGVIISPGTPAYRIFAGSSLVNGKSVYIDFGILDYGNPMYSSTESFYLARPQIFSLD